MQIINSPKRFASMQSNALFEVRPESAEPTEIKILDSEGSPVGVKKFAACDSFKVNVAPYWGHLLQVEPCGVESPNVFLNNDRVVTVKIAAESGAQSLESQAVPLLYAKFDSEVGALLNKIPEPKIIYRNGCEQIDLLVDGQSVSAEIEVMTGGSTTASYEWGALPAASGVVSVVVNARKIIQMVGCETATMTFRLKISVGDAVRYVEYLLLTDAVIRDSWSSSTPFAFLPVQRDRFKFQFDISSSTPIMALTVENYHPFINIATALRAIAAESGYTIESEFFESGFFRSLYMSGNYPSTNSELLKSRMAFNAGRLSDSAVLSVEADQWIFANSSRPTGANVGNIVESADSHDDITFYNNGGCFQMLDGKIVFIPSEQAVIGFEYELRYECGFTVESVERLRTYDTVCLDDGVSYSFTVPNTVPVLNNSTHFRGTMILRCSLVADYNVRMRITFESGAVELFTVNYDYVYLSRAEYIASVGVEISTNGTDYTPVTDGWALYDSADYNGVVQVCVKLRSQPKLRSAGEIIRFDGIYFSGYDSATTFRLLSTTRLRPIFGESLGVGGKISTETLMAHDGGYQSALFGAVAQMFNLRFYTDRVCRKILVEPYDAFYAAGSTVDWRAKQDADSEITITEAGDSLSRTMTYLYQDGDGAVARWNEDNKKKFARWRVGVQNRLADEGESVVLNPLFTPTRGNASVLPSAQSAHLINVGDRLRYGVPNEGDMFVAPKVVRYLGMRPLLTGERWGWPAGITSYPLAAFHLTELSGSIDSDYNSIQTNDPNVLEQKGMTLCFDDYEGQRGLHQFYDNMYQQINSGRILKMNIRLTSADVEMLSMPNEVADLRSTFLLEVGGELLRCRLLEVEPFDSRQNKSTQCTFFVIN